VDRRAVLGRESYQHPHRKFIREKPKPERKVITAVYDQLLIDHAIIAPSLTERLETSTPKNSGGVAKAVSVGNIILSLIQT
jgi:hypothetical protein